MVEKIPYFFIDDKEVIKFPEGGCFIDSITHEKMLLSVAAPRTSYFVNDCTANPVNILDEIVTRGYEKIGNARLHDVYHHGMIENWPVNMSYVSYDIHLDFAKNGPAQCQYLSFDNRSTVQPVYHSVPYLSWMIYDADLNNHPEKERIGALRQFDQYNQIKNGMRMKRFAKSDISSTPGDRLNWAMAFYLRKAVQKTGLQPDGPALLTVAHYRDQSRVMTQKQGEKTGHDVQLCLSFNAIVKHPAALLNNLQMKSWFKNGEPRYTEQQFAEAAEWLNKRAPKPLKAQPISYIVPKNIFDKTPDFT